MTSDKSQPRGLHYIAPDCSIRPLPAPADRTETPERRLMNSMNVLSDEELDAWRDALVKVQREGTILPPGSNVLIYMAKAALSERAEAASHNREGMVMVPREPTPEMIQAMEDRQIEGASYIAETSIQYALWKEVYKAMLAASPVASQKE